MYVCSIINGNVWFDISGPREQYLRTHPSKTLQIMNLKWWGLDSVVYLETSLINIYCIIANYLLSSQCHIMVCPWTHTRAVGCFSKQRMSHVYLSIPFLEEMHQNHYLNWRAFERRCKYWSQGRLSKPCF